MAGNVLDRLFHKIKATAGICTPNLEQLSDYLQKGQEYVEHANRPAATRGDG